MPLCLAGVVAGQVPQPEAGVSFLASSTLVEALPPAAGAAGARARAAAGPALVGGVRLPVRPGVALAAVVVWQPTELEVEDAGGTRSQQSLSLLSGLIEARWSVRAPLELSAGLGAVRYGHEGTGLFAEGADPSRVVRVGAGAGVPAGRHRLTFRALAEYHDFGTPLLRAHGAGDARVVRYGLEGVFSWGGAR